MSIDKSTVQKIARLSSLAIKEDDIPNYIGELSNLLQLVEQVNSVDTQDVLPLAHPQELSARLRSDVVFEDDQRDNFQKQAPLAKDGYYLVPKVIE